ncbi:tyrosine-protein kinase domain-containing protein [Halodurantibacterium flavum]|uniref:GNVR domain-containing protein n=1 Tax=Halodurantibacterium flavum TaxID=1382802 RepID=A0ABW4SBS3_9RHOB
MERAEHDPGLKEAIALVQRQSGMITGIAAAVLVLAMLWLMAATPQYQATALLLVDPSPAELLDPRRPTTSQASESARVDSEVEILRADTTLLAVITREGLTPASLAGPPRLRDLLFGPGPAAEGGSDLATLRVFRERVTVRRRGLTHILAVSVRDADPAQAARLADALADVYMARQVAAKIAAATVARDVVQGHLDRAAASVVRAEAAVASQGGVAVAPVPLVQELEAGRRHYMVHLDRLRDLDAQTILQVADSRLVSAAVIPATPAFPNRRMTLAVALALGLGLGLGAAFLREFHAGGVTTQRQLQNLLGLPVLAAVPPAALLLPADGIATDPLGPFAEAVRKIRLGLDRDGAQVVLVASALAGEGKSTISLALARSFEGAGRRVLLIDSDLRHPGLHELAGLAPELGLLDYLRAPDRAGPAFCLRDPFSGAEIIAGAAAATGPTDTLLTDGAFARLVAEAREVFDVIILDSPPVLPVVDARLVARHADAILLVAGTGYATRSELLQAAGELSDAAAGARLSTVFNRSMEGVAVYRNRRNVPGNPVSHRPGRGAAVVAANSR